VSTVIKSAPRICPACGAPFSFDPNASIPYPVGNSLPSGVHPPECVHFCHQCRLGVGSPLFTEKEESVIYAKGEFWKAVQSRTNIRRLSLPLALAEARWAFVRALNPSSDSTPLRILDIGAGQGAFGITAAMDSGARRVCYTALEPDRRLRGEIVSLWRKLGLAAELKEADGLEDLKASDGPYDLVVLSHVIEHLREPRSYLGAIRGLLSSGGILFVEVPHQDFLFKADVFPHVLFFTPENLRILLESEGFKVEKTGTFGRDWKVNPLGKHISPAARFSVRAISRFSGVLPLALQKMLYNRFYGIGHSHPNGIWLRAVAKLP
jgi:SAM-dependent methyltransferase